MYLTFLCIFMFEITGANDNGPYWWREDDSGLFIYVTL